MRSSLEETLHHLDEPLNTVHAFALFGGAALYLVAHVVLRLRNARTVNIQRLVVAVVLLALIPAGAEIDALVSLGMINGLLWLVIGHETLFVYDQRRYRLRHNLDVEIPGGPTAS